MRRLRTAIVGHDVLYEVRVQFVLQDRRKIVEVVSQTTTCSDTESLLLSAVAMHSIFRRVRAETGSTYFSVAPIPCS
jgi:hypothetical protein